MPLSSMAKKKKKVNFELWPSLEISEKSDAQLSHSWI
jgi:hypothetical protein